MDNTTFDKACVLQHKIQKMKMHQRYLAGSVSINMLGFCSTLPDDKHYYQNIGFFSECMNGSVSDFIENYKLKLAAKIEELETEFDNL